MSPILYNFAINPLLSHLNKLKGVSSFGQNPIKALAFADNCVLGIADNQDSYLATKIISWYESVSQAKLNLNKSFALKNVSRLQTFRFKFSIQQSQYAILGFWLILRALWKKLWRYLCLEKCKPA